MPLRVSGVPPLFLVTMQRVYARSPLSVSSMRALPSGSVDVKRFAAEKIWPCIAVKLAAEAIAGSSSSVVPPLNCNLLTPSRLLVPSGPAIVQLPGLMRQEGAGLFHFMLRFFPFPRRLLLLAGDFFRAALQVGQHIFQVGQVSQMVH
jgi:hypothetical protein